MGPRHFTYLQGGLRNESVINALGRTGSLHVAHCRHQTSVVDMFLQHWRKDWWDPRPTSKWVTGGTGPSPFKPGTVSPLRAICKTTEDICLDYCHAFHLGMGQDVAASSVVLMALLFHFGTSRALNARLEVAYSRYSLWCKTNRRTTSVPEFTKLGFDMNQTLSLSKDRSSVGKLPIGICINFFPALQQIAIIVGSSNSSKMFFGEW